MFFGNMSKTYYGFKPHFPITKAICQEYFIFHTQPCLTQNHLDETSEFNWQETWVTCFNYVEKNIYSTGNHRKPPKTMGNHCIFCFISRFPVNCPTSFNLASVGGSWLVSQPDLPKCFTMLTSWWTLPSNKNIFFQGAHVLYSKAFSSATRKRHLEYP